MKKSLFLGLALLASGNAFAVTDHYLLRDGNHVHHLKITQIGDEITVSTDVNFEPNPTEVGRAPCSAEVSGEAKRVAENELVLRKQIEGEARYCTLKIHLSPAGAKIEQSEDCQYYAAGLCHFESDGKELVKIK
jgi:hypothetical protein